MCRKDDVECKMEHEVLKTCLREVWSNETVLAKRDAMDNRLLENYLAFEAAGLCLKHLDSIYEDGFELDSEEILQVANPTTLLRKAKGRTFHNQEFEMIDVGGGCLIVDK